MSRRERNLDRMRLAAERMDERMEDFLDERAERIEGVIAAADKDSTVSLPDFVARLRGSDEGRKDSH